MTAGFFIGQADLDKIISEMKKSFHDEVQKLKVETREQPMTRKETAKYLKCGQTTLTKHWQHLKHVTEGGTPYWWASEIEKYIKEQ
jgi:hypothetical protein